jgi:hypothetical protein
MRQSGRFPAIRGIRAPKGKLDFIRALQPWFLAGEARFAQETGEGQGCEGWKEFLSFPLGTIDAANALAYCLHPRLKLGLPVYEDFASLHVQPELLFEDEDAFLALNQEEGLISGCLAQFGDGHMLIHADFQAEGDPGEEAKAMVQKASRLAKRQVRVVIPREDKYTGSGFRHELAKARVRYEVGGALEDGRSEVRHLLATQKKGFPAFRISAAARTTLNGLAGGYCRAELKSGLLASSPEPGPYRAMLEALESLAATLRLDREAFEGNATSRSGERYFSARPSTLRQAQGSG